MFFNIEKSAYSEVAQSDETTDDLIVNESDINVTKVHHSCDSIFSWLIYIISFSILVQASRVVLMIFDDQNSTPDAHDLSFNNSMSELYDWDSITIPAVHDLDSTNSTNSPATDDKNIIDQRNLCFEHFPKAGGTFMVKVLKHMDIPNLKISSEFQQNCNPEKHFILGNIRDPCSYYLSLWAYGCKIWYGAFTKSFTWREDDKILHDLFYSDSYNATLFQQWVRFVGSLNDFNLYSYRLAYKYGRGTNPAKNLLQMRESRNREEDLSSMKRVNEKVDCWIQTENMKEDMWKCLKEYENISHYSPNWEKFEEESSKTGEKRNRSDHKECSFYWTEDLKRYIYERDRVVIDTLDLQCCDENFPS